MDIETTGHHEIPEEASESLEALLKAHIAQLQADNKRLHTIIDNRAEDLEVKAKYEKAQIRLGVAVYVLDKHKLLPEFEQALQKERQKYA